MPARHGAKLASPAVIVVGASEGGVQAVRSLCAGLPAALNASVFIVLHIGAHKSQLPQLLNEDGPLPAVHPSDGDRIQAGHIYVAPPDRHMVLERGHVRLTRGPRENWARPAVDPLFRSAARAYGPNAIGVILTGGLNDGTAGLYEIKQRGGVTVVQEPDDAVNPSMPRSALAHVSVDHRATLADMPQLLAQLAGAHASGAQAAGAQASGAQPGGMPPSIMPALAGTHAMTAEYKLDEPVAVTCPDCGGALRRTELGSLTQFRCHIGHVYTANVLVAAQYSAMEWSLEAAMRAMSERGDLCRQMAAKSRADGYHHTADRWDDAMKEARDRTAVLRGLLEKDWLHPGEAEPPAQSAARRHG